MMCQDRIHELVSGMWTGCHLADLRLDMQSIDPGSGGCLHHGGVRIEYIRARDVLASAL